MNAHLLPTVAWGSHRLTRLLLGHNPLKGGSHFSDELSAEMRQWHQDQQHCLATLRRCEECGINTVQFGGSTMHRLLAAHAQAGGRLQWIATLYGNEAGNLAFGDQLDFEAEVRQITAAQPRAIGIQHFGESTDRYYFGKRLPLVRERMKRLRDTGLLIGVCTHLPEVAEQIAAQAWDIDFYQLSFHTVYCGMRAGGIDRTHEVFEDSDRERMVKLIRSLDKPVLAFKVLGANRKCGGPQQVKDALRFALENVKPSDVVCVGMWQKYRDQIGEDCATVKDILSRQ